MQDFIRVARALSDKTRLRILNVLLDGEHCVCEIMQTLDISQSRASRNLGILQNAGLLTARRDGMWIVYAVDWQSANSYAVSLAELLRDSPIRHEVLEQDRKRLSRTARTGPEARPEG